MSLEAKVMDEMKAAMKNKDKDRLRGLRAIKSAIQLAKTSGSEIALDEAAEIKMLQKLIKQRQDSLDIFEKQNREDLAVTEREEIAVIQDFLPEQLGEAELIDIIQNIIDQVGASSIKDMGKVMGMASAKVSGKADGKTISGVVKKLLLK